MFQSHLHISSYLQMHGKLPKNDSVKQWSDVIAAIHHFWCFLIRQNTPSEMHTWWSMFGDRLSTHVDEMSTNFAPEKLHERSSSGALKRWGFIFWNRALACDRDTYVSLFCCVSSSYTILNQPNYTGFLQGWPVFRQPTNPPVKWRYVTRLSGVHHHNLDMWQL